MFKYNQHKKLDLLSILTFYLCFFDLTIEKKYIIDLKVIPLLVVCHQSILFYWIDRISFEFERRLD